MPRIASIQVQFEVDRFGDKPSNLLEDIFDSWLGVNGIDYVTRYFESRLGSGFKVTEVCWYYELLLTLDVPVKRFDLREIESQVLSIEASFIAEHCFDGARSIHQKGTEYLAENAIDYQHIKASNGNKKHDRVAVESIFNRKLTRYLSGFNTYQNLLSS